MRANTSAGHAGGGGGGVLKGGVDCFVFYLHTWSVSYRRPAFTGSPPQRHSVLAGRQRIAALPGDTFLPWGRAARLAACTGLVCLDLPALVSSAGMGRNSASNDRIFE